MSETSVHPSGRAEVAQLLHEHKILPTAQRVEIAQLLFSRPQHLSAEQVLALVNDGRSVVSKATVYNTLRLLASKGLIREVIVDPTRVFYDSNIGDHHHLYNVDTGELTDVHTDALSISRVPDLPEGTESVGIDVIVRVRNTSR
jgi:Fur family iron response transcriptional regulator